MDIEGLEQERPPENSSTILTYSELERRCLTLEESNQSLVNMCSRLINNFESRKKHFTKNLSRLLDQNSDLMEKYVDLVRHNNEVSSSLEVMDKLIRTMKENLNNCLSNVGIERTVQESVLQESSTVCDPLPINSHPTPSDDTAQESIRVQSGRQNFSKINPMSPIQEEVTTPIKSRSHPTLHSFKKFDISDSTSISNPRKTIGTVFPSCPETCAELSSSSEKVGLKRSLLGLKHLRKAIGPETLAKNVPHDETIQVEPSGVEQLSSDHQTRKNQHENFRLVDTKSKRTETSIAESSMGNFGTDLPEHGIFGAISCSEVETFESLAKKSKVMADVNVDQIPGAYSSLFPRFYVRTYGSNNHAHAGGLLLLTLWRLEQSLCLRPINFCST
ncbi:unnamed protein product [Nesidiocoris tenuis]|uniref:Uncharacterized protein n=1 Tax=Nesidiocoris tenuis TaxID=355587 RepID=A0A6H5H6C5_9HEMI|nr:unnamed protein product [Nesidiocoris tenuis]CAB0011275.1 unnamed protein product [Nesidiocoris tenuis]